MRYTLEGMIGPRSTMAVLECFSAAILGAWSGARQGISGCRHKYLMKARRTCGSSTSVVLGKYRIKPSGQLIELSLRPYRDSVLWSDRQSVGRRLQQSRLRPASPRIRQCPGLEFLAKVFSWLETRGMRPALRMARL